MREIKFRAFIKQDKILDKHLILNDVRIYDVAIIDFESKIASLRLKGLMDFSFNQIELMQYIGLKDKNGKEIYEGDILQYQKSKRKFYIAWNEGYKLFCARFTDDENVPDYFRAIYNCEFDLASIIGNLHENPELLVKGENP